MKAGRLDRRITIETEYYETVDRNGTVKRTFWTPGTTIPAELVQQSTDEFMRSYGEESESVIVFRIRWRPGVKMTDRVCYEGRVFNIVELKEIGRRVGLEIRCEVKR